jgi:hypothetical protein
MLHETSCVHITAGYELCRAVAAETGRPVVYTAGIRELLESCIPCTGALNESQITEPFLNEPFLYVSPVLREDWMNLRR